VKKFIAVALLIIYGTASFACSTFLINKNGHLVFGRNYDWVTGNGMLLVNARGVQKTSFVPESEKSITWTSQCGSITFNQFGKEFPHGGMNENGLVVELMWLAETSYPQQDGRAAMNELQWIQYQLDNFTSVNDVINSQQHIRIHPQGAAPLHFLVADAQGNAATIEFIKGKMVVHRGKDLAHPVLTNTIYSDALREMEKSNSSDNSVNRFATACSMITQYQSTPSVKNPVAFSFGVLNKIAQGDYTKWKIVYDISNREIFFETNNRKKQVAFKDINFTCSGTSLFVDLNGSQQGNIDSSLAPLTFEQNKTMLELSAQQSGSMLNISAQTLKGAAQYMKMVKCKE
jgi:choloylglycine hydrolase